MSSELTINGVLRAVTRLLESGGVVAHPDAELLVGHVLGETRGRVQALALLNREISVEAYERAIALASERAQRVPLQHLTGLAAFREMELAVGPGVFIPRPETEMVAQLAIDELRRVAALGEGIAVDLCAGSGAIGLSLVNELPAVRVWSIEKSIDAHAWASRNVQRFGDNRLELILGDIMDSRELLEPLAGKVNVLISNPPYVPEGMIPRDPEVRDHDPELALYSGEDGLDLVRVISDVALDLVQPGGLLVLEHAEMQGKAIRDLLLRKGWQQPETHQDFTHRDRATTAIR